MRHNRAFVQRWPLPLLLLASLMAFLWVVGGASRGDVLGQVFARGGACIAIVVALLSSGRFEHGSLRPIWLLLLAAFAIPLIQLIPLPPRLWVGLGVQGTLPPTGDDLVWRALTMSPGATLNAAGALLVPAAALVLLALMSEIDRARVLTPLLVFIGTAAIFGIIPFSGGIVDNPFINDSRGQVSSVFANRNHFSLLLAMGCVVTPVWAFADQDRLRWRGPLAAALMLLLVLMVIATGSRSGILLVTVSLALSFALVGKRIRRTLRGAPPWMLPAIASTAIIVLALFVTFSFLAGRVEAVDRLFSLAVGEDLRVRAQPTLLTMITIYFPWGGGLGSFDPAFRLNEPDALLAAQYFNQAHNDYLGLALDAGLPGMILLSAAVLWWAGATIKVLRASSNDLIMLGRLGSALLVLVFVASVTDYPARTPTIMVIIVIAGVWLATASAGIGRSALPQRVSDV